jgi:hypothetical protein
MGKKMKNTDQAGGKGVALGGCYAEAARKRGLWTTRHLSD